MYGLCAQNLQSALGLTIGLDRFLAVYYPVRYIIWSNIPYLVALLFPSAAYAVALTAYGYSQTDETKIVGYCFPPTAFNGPSLTAWIDSNGAIVILVIIVYSATAIQLRRSHHSSTESIKRVIGSLQLIVGVYCASWALTILANSLVQNIAFSIDTKNWILMFTGWLVVINSSCNFFIYAWRSTDFRAAFAKLLRIRSKATIVPAGGATVHRSFATQGRTVSVSNHK
uniref:G-protein coupled receptors family 1 profile domain-containing protein n=1 Tax=Plectus sambesii TaxID=2011161 RepID=A0A914W761_9BILA